MHLLTLVDIGSLDELYMVGYYIEFLVYISNNVLISQTLNKVGYVNSIYEFCSLNQHDHS